jgi:hypothetical protein
VRSRRARCSSRAGPDIGEGAEAGRVVAAGAMIRPSARAKCCGCTEAFQASRAGSIPVARLRDSHGEWRSLVAHPAGGRAVAGSNPVSPIGTKGPQRRAFLPRGEGPHRRLRGAKGASLGQPEGLTRREAERALRRMIEAESLRSPPTIQERPRTVDRRDGRVAGAARNRRGRACRIARTRVDAAHSYLAGDRSSQNRERDAPGGRTPRGLDARPQSGADDCAQRHDVPARGLRSGALERVDQAQPGGGRFPSEATRQGTPTRIFSS